MSYLFRIPLLRRIFSEATLRTISWDLQRLRVRAKGIFRRSDLVPPFDHLHLGCGRRRVAGWLNVDLTGSDFDIDIANGSLPWRSGSFKIIAAQQVIEHLHWRTELLPLLGECLRVLKPDGELWLTTPDLQKVCEGYILDKGRSLLDDIKSRHPLFSIDPAPNQDVVNYLFHQNGEHKNLFDFEFLVSLLHNAGFGQVERTTEVDWLRLHPSFPSRHDDFQSLCVRARR